MALPVLKPVTRKYVYAYLADSSADTSAFTVSPVRGRITKAWSIIYNAITSADTNIAVNVNTVAVTGLAWVIATASSAAGDVDSAVPTSLALSRVVEGDTIEFDSDGGGSTTCPTMFVAEIEMD